MFRRLLLSICLIAFGSTSAFSQAGPPLAADSAGRLAVDLSKTSANATAIKVDASGTIISVSPQTGNATNRSGSIAAGGSSQTAIAANSSRKGFLIQNPCTATTQGISTAENLFINFTSAASTSAGTSIELGPCDSFSSVGTITTETITVTATTTGHKYVAKEQ